MFVPVACSQCGKPFQAPESELGKPVVCPWCRATVPALPVAAPSPAAPPPGAESPPASPLPWPQPEPLSLDDAAAAEAPPAPPRRHALRFWFRVFALVSLVLIPTGAATVIALRYKQGHVPDMEWREFAVPGTPYRVELLGKPTEATEDGAKRYAAEGWYSGTVTWVGWRDLTQVERQYALAKDGWVQLREKLFDPERDRLAAKYGGTVTRQATPKLDNPITHEVRVQYDGGQAAERIVVVVNDFSARVYFVGIAGRIDPDGEAAKHFFDSFRLTE
jgi:hypothetical protein